MPGFDRTGPAGEGPMTGGRQGLCTGNSKAGGRRMGFGRWGGGSGGRGRGYGRGNGRGRGYAERYMDETSGGESALRTEITQLRKQLDEMKRTIEGLRKSD